MTDYDDQYYRQIQEEEDYQEMERWNQKVQKWHGRKTAEAVQDLQNRMWKKALDKFNMTPQEFQELAQLDPEYYNRAYESGLENLVRTVKERPRDEKGRFIPMNQSQRQPQGQHEPQSQARIDALKEKIRKQGFSSDSDIEELIDSEIGRLF